MTISVTAISPSRCATDNADARGAWMIQLLCSYRKMAGLRKLCTWGIEDGSRRMTIGDLFNGKAEHRGPPRKRSGAEIYELLKNWEECPSPGKTKKKAPEPLLKVLKTMSMF